MSKNKRVAASPARQRAQQQNAASIAEGAQDEGAVLIQDQTQKEKEALEKHIKEQAGNLFLRVVTVVPNPEFEEEIQRGAEALATIANQLSDGVQLGDDLIPVALAIPAALKLANSNVLEALRDSDAERTRFLNAFKAKFDIEDDKLESTIENALEVAEQVAQLLNILK